MPMYQIEVQLYGKAFVTAASPEEALAKVKERYGNPEDPEQGMEITVSGDEIVPFEVLGDLQWDICLSPRMLVVGASDNTAQLITPREDAP
jgi:hypothetical protein